MRGSNSRSGLLVVAVLSSLPLFGCAIHPLNTGGGNSGDSCSFTLSGAVSTSSSVDCGTALAVEDGTFWQVSISQVGASSTFSGFTCTLTINGATPQTGTYTQSSMPESSCTVNPPGDKGDNANNWSEVGGSTPTGAVSITINSLSSFASNDYDVHGSGTFTLVGQGTAAGTVTGTVTF